MTETMMALGDFRFGMDTAAYQTLVRTHNYKWASVGRFGRQPAQQFIGKGDETVSFSGVIYPHFRGGLGQIAAMRTLADKGVAVALVDGEGWNWGLYIIAKIKEGQSYIDGTGIPYKQTFALDLRAYGEDATNAEQTQ